MAAFPILPDLEKLPSAGGWPDTASGTHRCHDPSSF
jgi:hypothetical protein